MVMNSNVSTTCEVTLATIARSHSSREPSRPAPRRCTPCRRRRSRKRRAKAGWRGAWWFPWGAGVTGLAPLKKGFPSRRFFPISPPVTQPRLNVLAIGDAIVDVIASTEDEFLTAEGLVKGSMRLIDAEEATRLYSHMGQARETSGGSAANTMAGIAAMGGRTGFGGQVAADQPGEIFAHDIRALGVEYETRPLDVADPT